MGKNVHVSDILRRFKARRLPNLNPFLESLKPENDPQAKELEEEINALQSTSSNEAEYKDASEEFLGEEGWDCVCYKCQEPEVIVMCDGRFLTEDPYSTEKPCSRSCNIACAGLTLEPDEECEKIKEKRTQTLKTELLLIANLTMFNKMQERKMKTQT